MDIKQKDKSILRYIQLFFVVGCLLLAGNIEIGTWLSPQTVKASTDPFVGFFHLNVSGQQRVMVI